jgi:hypothetical protein
MRTYFVLAVAALLGLAGPVLGQQRTGDTELQLQGNLSVAGSGDQDNSGSVSVILGHFFTDLQEIGADVTGTFVANGKFVGSVAPFYRYNFSTGKIVPYLGVTAGTTFGNTGGGTSTLASVEVGARFFVDSKTAFTVNTGKSYFFKQKEFDPGLNIAFGFSHLW